MEPNDDNEGDEKWTPFIEQVRRDKPSAMSLLYEWSEKYGSKHLIRNEDEKPTPFREAFRACLPESPAADRQFNCNVIADLLMEALSYSARSAMLDANRLSANFNIP